MQLNKKYYSISEVAEELQVPQYKLRYLETLMIKGLKINKVKGRRYYTKDDIQIISNYLNRDLRSSQNIILSLQINIDSLINKFKKLQAELNEII